MTEIRSIKELVKTPGNAVRHMVNGLRRYKNKEGFKINMDTYGTYRFEEGTEPTCYGCAATCSVQDIADHDFTYKEIGLTNKRASALNYEPWELFSFENAINILRMGRPVPIYPKDQLEDLLYFFDFELVDCLYKDAPKTEELEDDFTDEQLLQYLELAEWLDNNTIEVAKND